MKIVLYDDYKVGLLKDGNVVDVSGVVPRGGTPQLTIEGLITNFQSLKGALERALDQGQGVPLASVQLRAPMPRPGKIVCMGGNFGEFVGRKGPMWGFLKSPEAVLAPGGTVMLPPEDANIFPSRARAGGGHRPYGLPDPHGRRPQERLWLHVRLRRLRPLSPRVAPAVR